MSEENPEVNEDLVDGEKVMKIFSTMRKNLEKREVKPEEEALLGALMMVSVMYEDVGSVLQVQEANTAISELIEMAVSILVPDEEDEDEGADDDDESEEERSELG